MKFSQILRLGLFQLAAGGISVLFLGVLNRVMRVELGLSLVTVSVLVGGGHYLGAFLSIPFGFYSDRHTLFGYRRSGYILAGLVGTVAVLVAAPSLIEWLAADPVWWRWVLVFACFLFEGATSFVAGTAYLALITESNPSAARGRATSIIWTMLMIGIIATGIGVARFLPQEAPNGGCANAAMTAGAVRVLYSLGQFNQLFAVFGGLALLFGLVGVIGHERRVGNVAEQSNNAQTSRLRQALRTVGRNPQMRIFASFLAVSMFSFFMYDVILEPFGGDVFCLSPAVTTRFNAYLGTGLILAMLLGGMALIPRWGKKAVTAWGCAILVVGFLGLALAGFIQQVALLNPCILLLGFGSGLYTVGSVSLMMDLTTTHATGLFIGVWTFIQAAAKGPAALAGGALQTLFIGLGASQAQAYGAVFVVEALGLVVALLFLRRLQLKQFAQQSLAGGFGALTGEALG